MVTAECPRCRRTKELATEPWGIITDAMLRCGHCGTKMRLAYNPIRKKKHRRR